MGGTRCSGIVSSSADVVWMSVVRGMTGVGEVCEMCMCLARGGVGGRDVRCVVSSQHPYCCVNNIVLILLLKQSKFDVLICSLNLFHSREAA